MDLHRPAAEHASMANIRPPFATSISDLQGLQSELDQDQHEPDAHVEHNRLQSDAQLCAGRLTRGIGEGTTDCPFDGMNSLAAQLSLHVCASRGLYLDWTVITINLTLILSIAGCSLMCSHVQVGWQGGPPQPVRLMA